MHFPRHQQVQSAVMHKTFYVTLYTPEATEEYSSNANTMLGVFRDVFMDKSKIAVLTKGVEIQSFETEVEVSACEEGGLIGRALVDIESRDRIGLDKQKLSQMLKASAPWKICRVEKRLVPEEDAN